MTKQSKNTIKSWFKNGSFPDQFHFWDWMDSFFHKDEQIPASQIDQLQDLLDAKLDRKDLPDGEMAMDDIYGLNSALDGKVDKQEGKGLSAEDFSSELKLKLDGLEEGANKYEHPLTHSANMIEETADKAFTSDAEKLANANHIANADIHKTSEQIRSEIVDADIPESIARMSDVVSTGGLYDWSTEENGGAASGGDVTIDASLMNGKLTKLDMGSDTKMNFTNLTAGDFGIILATCVSPTKKALRFVKDNEETDVYANTGTENKYSYRGYRRFFVGNGKPESIEWYYDGISLMLTNRSYNSAGYLGEARNSQHNNSGAKGITLNSNLLHDISCGYENDTASFSLATYDMIEDTVYTLLFKNTRSDSQKTRVELNGLTLPTGGEVFYLDHGRTAVVQILKHLNIIYVVGYGNNSDPSAASDGPTPTLQAVTEAGAITDQFVTFSGGIRTTAKNSERLGFQAANSNSSGDFWTAVGRSAGFSNTSGDTWTALGRNSGFSSTSGTGWTAIGAQAGSNNITGDRWTALGHESGRNNTAGSEWVSIGHNSALNNTAGSNWLTVGANAAATISDGSIATSFSNSVYVGDNTKTSAEGVTNENVFGFDARGMGTNTIVLGNPSITDVHSDGTFNSSNASPLASSPGGTNATAGDVLTADGSGGSSWEAASGGGFIPTLQQVTEQTLPRAETNIPTVFTGGVMSSVSSGVRFGNFAAENVSNTNYTTFGYRAGQYNSNGSLACFGNLAGTFNIGGAQAVAHNNSTYIGDETRVSGYGISNENVFGYSAYGAGSNTVRLGNTSITDVYTSGTYNTSAVSPLSSAPSGENATNGYVLTADGAGNSSWQVVGGGTTPTLQTVTDEGSSTTNNIVTTGTATASNFILSSDETLKTFKDNDPVAFVDKVKIQKFTFKDDKEQRTRHGVSAQKLQKVAPEMVYEDTDKDKTLKVGYIDFLLAKVSNQDDKIEALEMKIDSLIKMMGAR